MAEHGGTDRGVGWSPRGRSLDLRGCNSWGQMGTMSTLEESTESQPLNVLPDKSQTCFQKEAKRVVTNKCKHFLHEKSFKVVKSLNYMLRYFAVDVKILVTFNVLVLLHGI